MTLKEAQTLTLRILKQVMEEKLDQHNVQLAQVSTILPIWELSFLSTCTGNTREGIRDLERDQFEGGYRSHVIVVLVKFAFFPSSVPRNQNHTEILTISGAKMEIS